MSDTVVHDSDVAIHGCYKSVSGELRVIDTDRGQSCLPRESALDWNQTGQQGLQGEQGEPDPRGSARAYGQITAQGIPYWRRNLNIASVDHIETGVYCVYVDASIDMLSSIALVTAEGGTAERRYLTAYVGCGSSGQGIQVNVFNAADEPENATFYLSVP